MILTIIESPYAAGTCVGHWLNVRYARKCMRDSLMRGEAPIASHLLYTQPGILDDEIGEQRERGIEAGLAWGRHGMITAVYIDRGISPGMRYGIEAAKEAGRPVHVRSLYGQNTIKPEDL